jgi:hypothetical protein
MGQGIDNDVAFEGLRRRRWGLVGVERSRLPLEGVIG